MTEFDWTTCISIHFGFNVKISLKFYVSLGSITLENIQHWFQFDCMLRKKHQQQTLVQVTVQEEYLVSVAEGLLSN